MPVPVICNSTRTHYKWKSGLADSRLEFIIYALAGYMLTETGKGIRIISLGDKSADLNPPWSYEKMLWKVWRYHAKKFLDDHTEGVQSIICGLPEHLHIEISPQAPLTEVVLT